MTENRGDLISREAALKELEWYQKAAKGSRRALLTKLVEFVAALTAVDAQPVVHGRWVPHMEEFDEEEGISLPGGFYQTGWQCSVCGRTEPDKEPYCNCGAKMNRGVESAETG